MQNTPGMTQDGHGGEEEAEAHDATHPWFGVPASERIHISFPRWSVRRSTSVYIGGLLGRLRDDTNTYLKGKLSSSNLVSLSLSESPKEYLPAAADPKLPERWRTRLVEQCSAMEDGEEKANLIIALIANPCLSTDECERVIGSDTVTVHNLLLSEDRAVTLLYEHPNCSSTRLAELLADPRAAGSSEPSRTASTRDRETPIDPSLLIGHSLGGEHYVRDVCEATSVCAAAIHLKLTLEQVSDLVRRWHRGVVEWTQQEQESQPEGSLHETWSVMLGRSAARLCTHPQISPQDTAAILSTISRTYYLQKPPWNALVEEWSELSGRSIEIDYTLLTRCEQIGFECKRLTDEIVLSGFRRIESSEPGSSDSGFLLFGLHCIQDGDFSKKNEEAVQVLKRSSSLLGRVQWTREVVRRLMTSREQSIREIGVQGVAQLAKSQKSTGGPARTMPL